jgi:hypothetical protein
MALRFALRHPRLVAGAASLAGRFPHGRPLARLLEARRLQLLLASGQRARAYGPEQVCDDLRLCHAAGLNITLRHYPCGDELHEQMLADLNRWMMEQVCPAAAGVDAAAQQAPGT